MKRTHHPGPATLWIGIAVISVCELLLFAVELPGRNWSRLPILDAGPVTLAPPDNMLEISTRWVAMNITPLCWIGYLLLFDGLLTQLSLSRQRPEISSIRIRPNRFVFAWLTSIPVWCYFDWVNFYFMRAWSYHGLPEQTWSRYVGYFIAFAAINPGMFLAAQWFNQLGLRRLRTTGVRIPLVIQIAVLLLGVVFLIYPFVVVNPIGSMTLWVSLIFLLDPVNHWLGRPSIIGDWRAGRWGRTLALMAGGALCGLCWEFWNYWAIAKWTYDLPFLGAWQSYRYFEMPWIGFLGFLPFAIECWVILISLEALTERLGIRIVEHSDDDETVF